MRWMSAMVNPLRRELIRKIGLREISICFDGYFVFIRGRPGSLLFRIR